MDISGLGSRIKHMREKRRLRQADVAAALRISAQAVSKWERGENAPDIAVLVDLAHLLGVSVEWILTGSEVEPGTFPAAVFATSLRGYAERATRVAPSALAAWANAIHFAVTEAVLHHDGVPIKCVGDGLLAFFSGVSKARRALDAAREARLVCEQPELVTVLHSGPVFLGSIGHPDYARTDILGATVNTTFLLMAFVAAHNPTRIGTTRAFLDDLGSFADFKTVGSVEVLGLSLPIEVFEPGY